MLSNHFFKLLLNILQHVPCDLSPQVAVLWRKTRERVQYDWLEEGWPLELTDVQRSKRRLTKLIDLLLTSAGTLPFVVELPVELIDENGQVGTAGVGNCNC